MLLNKLEPGVHCHWGTLGGSLECTSQSYPIHGTKGIYTMNLLVIGGGLLLSCCVKVHQWLEKTLGQNIVGASS